MATPKKNTPPKPDARKLKNVEENHPFPMEEEPEVSMVEEPEVAYIRTTKAFAFIMGNSGKKDFPPVASENDFISAIRQGIPKKAIDNLVDKTGISTNEMAVLMRLSDRTLRRYKPQTLLNPEQSEKVVELSRLYNRGEEVFGNLNSFKEWMNSSVMALGNIKPKQLLDTSLGIDMLMNELGKIEHGIFA